MDAGEIKIKNVTFFWQNGLVTLRLIICFIALGLIINTESLFSMAIARPYLYYLFILYYKSFLGLIWFWWIYVLFFFIALDVKRADGRRYCRSWNYARLLPTMKKVKEMWMHTMRFGDTDITKTHHMQTHSETWSADVIAHRTKYDNKLLLFRHRFSLDGLTTPDELARSCTTANDCWQCTPNT